MRNVTARFPHTVKDTRSGGEGSGGLMEPREGLAGAWGPGRKILFKEVLWIKAEGTKSLSQGSGGA